MFLLALLILGCSAVLTPVDHRVLSHVLRPAFAAHLRGNLEWPLIAGEIRELIPHEFASIVRVSEMDRTERFTELFEFVRREFQASHPQADVVDASTVWLELLRAVDMERRQSGV